MGEGKIGSSSAGNVRCVHVILRVAYGFEDYPGKKGRTKFKKTQMEKKEEERNRKREI